MRRKVGEAAADGWFRPLRVIRRPDLVATKLTFGGAGPEAVNELAGKLTVLYIAPKAPDNLKVSQHLKLG